MHEGILKLDARPETIPMLPLDPPLSRGARPGWVNTDRPIDDAEFQELDGDPDNPEVQARFARHLLEHDPENIWAMITLSENAQSEVERIVILREAVRVGLRLWSDQIAGRLPAPDWGQDRETMPFTGAVLGYGLALMETGHRDEAAACLRFLLRLDPADNVGAVEALSGAGLVVLAATPDVEHAPRGR